jgi:hypothetical protein
LFLLHWYLGYRAAQLSERQAWMSFSYATRPTARLFCEQLVTAQPPPDESAPAAWIVDQPWYLYVWRDDPTIQAMLVMIDAIHSRFADCDPRSAWQRLIASDARRSRSSSWRLQLAAPVSHDIPSVTGAGQPMTSRPSWTL